MFRRIFIQNVNVIGLLLPRSNIRKKTCNFYFSIMASLRKVIFGIFRQGALCRQTTVKSYMTLTFLFQSQMLKCNWISLHSVRFRSVVFACVYNCTKYFRRSNYSKSGMFLSLINKVKLSEFQSICNYSNYLGHHVFNVIYILTMVLCYQTAKKSFMTFAFIFKFKRLEFTLFSKGLDQ